MNETAPAAVSMQAVLRIPGYDSFEQIAVGGMGVVYKARRLSLKKTVAIKVLLPHLSADARFIGRFQQEAEAAAKIQHDNIVNVVDYGRSESLYYIVMEYYDGLTVEELLRKEPRMPVDIALNIILNVCYGMEAAHAQQLVHRDIKPANIIVTRQGGVKVADFGLARAMDKLNLVSQAGKVVGTPAYMSPEQTRGEPVGPPSDIFSLGVVTFEVLTGKRPFSGEGYAEMVDQIQRHEAPSVSTLNPLVEEPVDRIVARMLEKTVEKRCQHVAETVMDLEGLMDRFGYARDRRALVDFAADPIGYSAGVRAILLEKLAGEVPATGSGRPARATAARYYRKVLYLDPNDEGARRFVESLGGEPAPPAPSAGKDGRPSRTPAGDRDPDAEYRVVLEAIDRGMETPETFAIKLAMRLKTPLPRMQMLVANMPSAVVTRIPYKKARWLTKVIEELGGTARMDTYVAAAPTPEPAKAREAPQRSDTPTRTPTERRTTSGGIICSRCGWEEEADAKFCSLCQRPFNKTDKIDVAGFVNPNDNPLGDVVPEPQPALGYLERARALPPRVYYIAGAGLALIALIIAILVR